MKFLINALMRNMVYAAYTSICKYTCISLQYVDICAYTSICRYMCIQFKCIDLYVTVFDCIFRADKIMVFSMECLPYP